MLVSQLVLFRCHFNPLPPHGGRRNLIMKKIDVIFISIHSLRMEGDNAMAHLSMQYMRFQSTPSAWRETEFTLHGKEYEGISIHSLRMEGDLYFNISSLQ